MSSRNGASVSGRSGRKAGRLDGGDVQETPESLSADRAGEPDRLVEPEQSDDAGDEESLVKGPADTL